MTISNLELMNIKFGVAARTFSQYVVPLFFVLAICIDSALGQVTKTFSSGGGRVSYFYRPIPEATESCSPVECMWWKKVRRAAEDLQKKRDAKAKASFVNLLLQGFENIYKVPIADRPPHVLFGVLPGTTRGSMPTKSGKVVLDIEYRNDLSVGEVRVVESVSSEIDKSCVESARQNIFLPAVKDRQFITAWQTGTCAFGMKF